MTQSVDRHSTRWFSQRRLWLLVVWGVTVATLRSVLPVEPRLILGKGEYVEVVGITPDSQELITLTRRAIRDRDSDVWCNFPSGPVDVWNLKTGNRRTYCVPGQACSGRMIPCRNDGGLVMEEPNGLTITHEDLSIRCDQFVFTQAKWRGDGHRDLMSLNFRNGEVRVQKRAKRSESQFISKTSVSPRARWSLKAIDIDPFTPIIQLRITEFGTDKELIQIQPTDQSRISEIETERDQFQIDGVASPIDSCFSPDDSHFACCVSDENNTTTRIWNVEAGEEVSTYGQGLWGLAFSQDRRFLAGYTSLKRDQNEALYREILVLDVQTAQAIRQLKLEIGKQDNSTFGHYAEGRLEFLDDDQWLIWHQFSHNYLDESSLNARINLKLTWNLDSNETHAYSNTMSFNTYDPSLSRFNSRPETPSYFLLQNGDRVDGVFEITTGRKVAEIPENAKSIQFTPEVMLVSQEEEFWLSRFLDARGIVLPRSVSSRLPLTSKRWLFIDVPSGRRICSIPEQDPLCWLSRDRKTLVTCPLNGDSKTIHVWDFPPQRPLLKPLLWSLLVPGIVVAWSIWKYRRRAITQTKW